MSIELILTFLGGIIGGGGLIKGYQSWLQHTENKKVNKIDTFQQIADRLTKEIEDVRRTVTEQRAYIAKLEEDIRGLKENNNNLVAQNAKLELRANLYEEQAQINKDRADDNEKEVKRLRELIEKNEQIS